MGDVLEERMTPPPPPGPCAQPNDIFQLLPGGDPGTPDRKQWGAVKLDDMVATYALSSPSTGSCPCNKLTYLLVSQRICRLRTQQQQRQRLRHARSRRSNRPDQK